MREICTATGLLGDDIRRLFPEPGFFADLFTSYYTDLEPGSCLVAEALGSDEQPQVVGYLLGCTNQLRHRRYQYRLLLRIACRVCRGLLQAEFNAAARSYIWWTVWRSWRETPRAPAGGVHFHFNFLKEWRNLFIPIPLLNAFLELLSRDHPELPVVWGQMTTYGRRRSAAAFRRFGWQFYDQVRLTKYDGMVRNWGQSPAESKEDGAGWGAGSQKYARCQLPEIYLTTIYRNIGCRTSEVSDSTVSLLQRGNQSPAEG